MGFVIINSFRNRLTWSNHNALPGIRPSFFPPRRSAKDCQPTFIFERNLVLGGLALGIIGMVVDNKIVMLENIIHHQQNTRSPLEGSLKAISEITSITTNLAAILLVLFIVDLVGLLFN
jgi:hypothetical protein